MEAYSVFKDLAIIVIAAKACGILARKLKAPQVVGEIVAGLLIGPSLLGWVQQTDFLMVMAEVGVVLLMFSAGLETNLKELMKTGPIALVIACAGVFIPLGAGTILYMAMYGAAPWGSEGFLKAVFVGTIMTATSVSITVQTLREMGRLKGRVGTTILSAAIIDDVIGIIVLTVVIGFKDENSRASTTIISTALFFVFALVIGYVLYRVFKKIDSMYPHTRRIPIAGLALCLGLAYIAERYFGIADITGAYVAGIILCNIQDSEYIARKMDINSYMLFGPIFFASIGLKTDIKNFSMTLLVFSIGFVLVALVSKIIGCGLVAKLCRFSGKDSLKIGVGMMTRGEVALIVAQKGLSAGFLESEYFTAVILLIIVSSVVTPILLKVLYHGEPADVQEVS
ncbi:cation:proton antiporter [Lawsonibacter sp. OA9]|uniref:cation:proton antiporter n=1 Tax=Oscillospiraceae TaxID=216572 RepID=UPI001F050727|nr:MULTISPECIES: cation:proton antiporter [Oscillospiraceae]MCH1978171.1 cation:proton antiporter [Lawsonibacter sp. OA9]MCH1983718.1 cation:proton antiporter [Ruminococcus sp. OA3]